MIEMLDCRVKAQQDILIESALTAARTNEMHLESDVLRGKLAELMYVVWYHTCLHLLISTCSGVLVELALNSIPPLQIWQVKIFML